MIIQAKEHITHPATLVFETIRDKTQDMVSFMPNIDEMEVLTREEDPPRVHLYNRWQGASNDVPRVVRPFIKRELISWHDRATWDQDALSCSWEIEASVGKDFFSCKGNTTIEPLGEQKALFSLKGELVVDPKRVPGVPRLLAGRLKNPMERFIANAISPNLTSIAKAVQQYLDRENKEIPA